MRTRNKTIVRMRDTRERSQSRLFGISSDRTYLWDDLTGRLWRFGFVLCTLEVWVPISRRKSGR